MLQWMLVLIAVTAWQLSCAVQLYCYYDSQAHWRRGGGQFRVRALEEGVEHCTRLVYGYATVDPVSCKVTPLDTFLDTDEGRQNYRHVTNLKRPFPNLQVLLSVGSQLDTEQSGKYLTLLESAQNRSVFINSARAIARRYGFDGIELAWQFPEVPQSRHLSALGRFWDFLKDVIKGRTKAELRKQKQQRDGFTALVKDLKAALQTDDMILTAVSYPLVNATAYFDIPEVIQHLDAVVLRAFDYNSPDKNGSGASPAAPLNATEERVVPSSVAGTVQLWLDNGAPADKLVLGIPTFGRTWKVKNDTGVPPLSADGPGDAGPLIKSRGLLAYPEICNNLTTTSSSSCTRTVVRSGPRPAVQTSVHAYCPTSGTWVSFDDPEMAGYKAAYALSVGLGGVQVVDLSLDDFGDLCGQGPYPVLREVHCTLQGGIC